GGESRIRNGRREGADRARARGRGSGAIRLVSLGGGAKRRGEQQRDRDERRTSRNTNGPTSLQNAVSPPDSGLSVVRTRIPAKRRTITLNLQACCIIPTIGLTGG